MTEVLAPAPLAAALLLGSGLAELPTVAGGGGLVGSAWPPALRRMQRP